METKTYYTLVNKETELTVSYKCVGSSQECYLIEDTQLPCWTCESFSEALRVLYNPVTFSFGGMGNPVHELDPKKYDIKEVTVEIKMIEENNMTHSIDIAKKLYKDIMIFKYGEKNSPYFNLHTLKDRLEYNDGVISQHELEEYLMFKEE